MKTSQDFFLKESKAFVLFSPNPLHKYYLYPKIGFFFNDCYFQNKCKNMLSKSQDDTEGFHLT